RFLEREAPHGARGVEHEDEFLGLDVGFGQTGGRLQDHSEVAASALGTSGSGRAENGVCDLGAGDVIFENEVFVRDHSFVAQADAGAAGALTINFDVVRFGTDILNGDAGIEREFHRDVVTGARAFGGDPRGDVRCVRNAIGVGRPAAALMAGRLSGNIARADHQRKYEFVGAFFIAQGFDVADGDGDLFAGQDVGDRLREDVGTLLIEQRGDVASVLGVLVDGTRFFTALDEATHSAVTDLDGHIVDGCVLRQRESVDGFDVLGRRVGEDLRDCNAGEEAADAGANVGVLQRAGALDFAVFPDDAERAGRGGFSG